MSECSDEDVEMYYEEEPVNFIDIAKRSSEVQVQVPPSRIMNVRAPWLNKAKMEATWSNPIEKAIIEDDFEAFCYLSRHTASIDVSVYIGEEGPRLPAPSNPQGSKPNPVCSNDFLRERLH